MKYVFYVLLSTGNAALGALFMAKGWAWLVYPALSVREIGMWHGYGLFLLVTYPAMIAVCYLAVKDHTAASRLTASALLTAFQFGFIALARWMML